MTQSTIRNNKELSPRTPLMSKWCFYYNLSRQTSYMLAQARPVTTNQPFQRGRKDIDQDAQEKQLNV